MVRSGRSPSFSRVSARRAGGGPGTVGRASRRGDHPTRRPQGRRRARPGRTSQRRPPGGLTARAAVLGLVVCALVLSLAYPVKQYLAQRTAVAELRREHAQVQARVDALRRQRQNLSDPEFVETLARRRLQYVMPGETALVVVDPHRPGRHRPAPAPVHALDSTKPWYSQLWDTVRVADGG